jgi:hypothetical protein
MSGPTNEPIEVQRQEAYRNGLYEARDMVWRRYIDGNKKNATYAEMHEALMRACRQAGDVLDSLRAAAPDVGKAQAPSPPLIIKLLAEWENANGTLCAVTPDEWMALMEPVANAAVLESPRMALAAIAQSAPSPLPHLLEAGKEEQR